MTTTAARAAARFGAAVRTLALTGETGETSLELRDLRPGLYGYLVRLADGSTQRGTLVVKD